MADQSIKDLAYRTAASVFGGPVDLATMVMRPFGYNTPDTQVFGSSEYIGKKMEDVGLVSSARSPLTEFIASVAFPMPGSIAAKGAALAAPLIGGMLVGKNAKTWDALAAQKAKMLADMGTDSRTIWEQTGTWKGSDGKWRQAIDSGAAQLPAAELVEAGKSVEQMSTALRVEELQTKIAALGGGQGRLRATNPQYQNILNLQNELHKLTTPKPIKIAPEVEYSRVPGLVYKDALPDEIEKNLRIYHGGSGEGFTAVPSGNVFDGFFGSSERGASWGSHGTGKDYFADVPEHLILQGSDISNPEASKALLSVMKNNGIPKHHFDNVWQAVAEDKNLPEKVMDSVFRGVDPGESGWVAQKLRGQYAKTLGYKAATMNDEHGISYLMVPGTKLTRAYSPYETPPDINKAQGGAVRPSVGQIK